MSETRRLGRGLEALLGPRSREEAVAAGALREIPVGAVKANPYQPRKNFDEAALAELAASLQTSGLLQPIIVRPVGSRYELIAGERRWRAAQRLGWEKIPAILRELDDQTALSAALIENLQRDDLGPIDAAHGYQRLVDEFHLSSSDVAKLIGKDRSTVANTLRLLKLPADIQEMVASGKLSEGHARALLAVANPGEASALAAGIVESGWSVREVEAIVRGDLPSKGRGKMIRKAAEPRRASADARRIEDALRRRLGTDVRLTAKRRGRGLLTISYYSNDDLARLLEVILGAPFAG